MGIETALQIFTNGFLGKAVSYEAVEQKLNSALSRLHADKVIMGWAPDRALYEKTAEFLLKKNIEFYFWFPVFSETGGLKDLSPLLDLQGRRIQGQGHGEEDFSFCCPNNLQNIERIIEIFEEDFASIPFTGVFLDKIRYHSFANARGSVTGQGLMGVLSCFCPHCLALYKKENLNPRELDHAFSFSGSAPLGIQSYNYCGDYTFENPVTAQFFLLKSRFITQSLERICGYFRGKKLKIGFDVFAPFLSPFVGQDLKSLSALCDFMKPMMYRITRAPAGLPYETETLLCETGFAYGHENISFFRTGIEGIKQKN